MLGRGEDQSASGAVFRPGSGFAVGTFVGRVGRVTWIVSEKSRLARGAGGNAARDRTAVTAIENCSEQDSLIDNLVEEARDFFVPYVVCSVARVGGHRRFTQVKLFVSQRVESLRAVSRVIENNRVAATRFFQQVLLHGLQNAVASGFLFFNNVDVSFREAVLGAGQKFVHGLHIVQGPVEIFPFPKIPPAGVSGIASWGHSRRFADRLSFRLVGIDSDEQGALGLAKRR